MGRDNKETAQPINMASPQQGVAKGRSRTTGKPDTTCQNSKRLLLHVDSPKDSPDGGIVLEPSDRAHTSLTTNNILTDHGHAQSTAVASGLPEPNDLLGSPSRQANIRVRRANIGSALLQSPARAGHAARMRQIFEDAGRDHISPQAEQTILYPQLPNISRKASPTRVYNRDEQHCTPISSPTRRPESLCVSTDSSRVVQHKPQLNSPRISEQSSESWSDDSGYFIAGSRNRTSSITVPPRDRINDWLTNLSGSEWKTPAIQDKLGGQRSNPSSPLSSPTRLTDNDPYNKSPERFPIPICDATIQDPFLDFDSNPHTPSLFKALPVSRRVPTLPPPPAPRNLSRDQTHSTSTVIIRSHPSPTKRSLLEDGGVQLSPLSPNVCIERGPTRYHSARTSPIKGRRTLPYDENETGAIELGRRKQDGEAEVPRSPLAPCKIGAGTRFQHPRHGARGLGRFGRCLESQKDDWL